MWNFRLESSFGPTSRPEGPGANAYLAWTNLLQTSVHLIKPCFLAEGQKAKHGFEEVKLNIICAFTHPLSN